MDRKEVAVVSLTELAERCEKAEGPDRELEYAIWDALNPPRIVDAELPRDFGRLPGVKEPERYAPDYTSSLDEALTLVPEGWAWNLANHDTALLGAGDPKKAFGACLAAPEMKGGPEPWTEDRDVFNSDAATPALALCAAALRARAATPA